MQQEANVSQAGVSLSHSDGKLGDEVESPLVAERTSEPKLGPSDRQARIQRAVKCLRCSTCERMRRPSSHRPSRIPTDGGRFDEKPFLDVCVLVNVLGSRDRLLAAAACSLWKKVRVEQSSRKWQTQRYCNIKWRGSIVSDEGVHALNQRTGGWELPNNTSV